MDTIITLLVAAMVLIAVALFIGCDADEADDDDTNDQKNNKEVKEDEEEGDPSPDDDPDASQDGNLYAVKDKPAELTSFNLCKALIATGLLAGEAEFQSVGICIDFFEIEFSNECLNFNAFMHCSEPYVAGNKRQTPTELLYSVIECAETYCE